MTDDDPLDETPLDARRRRLALRGAVVATALACVVAIVVIGSSGDGKSGVVISPGPGTTTNVGPFPFDPNDPTKKDTHWHAALGVYDCDHWMGDSNGSGRWQWPTATSQGAPARAAEPSVYAGLHSHEDGIIHMEPLVSAEAGRNATLGLYFEFGGWTVSSTAFDFLGTARKNGDTCGAVPGELQWEVATWDGTRGKQRYTVHSGDDPAQYKLNQFDVVVIAFLPQGTSIASIGDPPSVPILAGEMGPALVPPSSP